MPAALLVSLAATLVASAPRPASLPGRAEPDTLRLVVGSKEIDGRVYHPHAARVRIRIGDPGAPVTTEWTNQLALGDSAGRQVMRWVTRGEHNAPSGSKVTWELRQTYDARTLAPLGYHYRNSAGAWTSLRIDGVQVKGRKRTAADTTRQTVDATLDRPGFFAGASDLVPTAMALRPGLVMTIPLWSPSSSTTTTHSFSVIDRRTVTVEGKALETWRVEEHDAGGKLVGTWYLVDRAPWMVYAETPLPDGRTQFITETEIPLSPDP